MENILISVCVYIFFIYLFKYIFLWYFYLTNQVILTKQLPSRFNKGLMQEMKVTFIFTHKTLFSKLVNCFTLL